MCSRDMGFPDSSVGKESACDAGDTDSVPWSGRSTGEGISSEEKMVPSFWESWPGLVCFLVLVPLLSGHSGYNCIVQSKERTWTKPFVDSRVLIF